MFKKSFVFLLLVFFLYIVISSITRPDGQEVTHQPVNQQENHHYSDSYYTVRNGVLHRGTDIVGDYPGDITGDPVYAVEDGTVFYSQFNQNGAGHMIILDHGNGFATGYKHLQSRNVSAGDTVSSGDVIGHAGNTGQNTTGPHLHYEHKQYTGQLNNYNNATYHDPGNLAEQGYYQRRDADHDGTVENAERDVPWDDDERGGGDEETENEGEGPGNDSPDDNYSYYSNPLIYFYNQPMSLFLKLAAKKGKANILALYEYEKKLKERDEYFKLISSGGQIDNNYINSINLEIDGFYDHYIKNIPVFKNEIKSTPDFALLKAGFYRGMGGMINKFDEPYRRINPYNSYIKSNENPVLIIPSGSLFGQENNLVLASNIKEYVKNGGVLIVFAQQYGSQIENIVPIPEGESLKTYGWRQDQSCYWASSYFKGMHPVLAGQSNERVSAGVDGYFSHYPAGSTVLLRRIVNQEPCLLYYPYGQGTVILTSLYTDWGVAHSQATVDELRMVRDLITFARNPNQPIPMFNLAENPTPAVNLEAVIRNNTETIATKVKIRILTPDRTRPLFEIEEAFALNGGEEKPFTIHFDLPALARQDYGICHSDYELYDASGNILQPAVETDSGRFGVYQVFVPYQDSRAIVSWLTAESEQVNWGQDAKLTLHMRNNSSQTKTVQFRNGYIIGQGTPLISLTAAAGETVTFIYNYSVKSKGQIRVWINSLEGGVISKGITGIAPTVSSTIEYLGPHDKKAGEPLEYEIKAINTGKIDMACKISVSLLEYYRYSNSVEIFNTTETISAGQTYSFRGIYAGENMFRNNLYILYLTIEKPDGTREIVHSNHLWIKQSEVVAENIEIEGAETEGGRYYLKYGKEYAAKFKLKNNGFYNINNGRCEIRVEEATRGEELFKKVLANLQFTPGEEKNVWERFIFSSLKAGQYRVQINFSDETRPGTWLSRYSQNYSYRFNLTLSKDKLEYNYLETANVQLKIAGIESFHLKLTCAKMGFSEERDITVPAGQSQAVETFNIPVGFPVFNNYEIEYEISNGSVSLWKGNSYFQVAPIKMKMNGDFGKINARVGETLNLHLDVEGVCGFVVPLTAELVVQSQELTFNESRVASIMPGVKNSFDFSIPVVGTVAVGQHYVNVNILIAGHCTASMQVSIVLFLKTPFLSSVLMPSLGTYDTSNGGSLLFISLTRT